MNLNELQAKHDKAVADLNSINVSAAIQRAAVTDTANELGKAKLTAAIDLIRKVYKAAPFGSLAHGDIVALVRELTVPHTVTGTMKFPQHQQVSKGVKVGDAVFVSAPTSIGKSQADIYKDIVATIGHLQMFDKTTGKPSGTLETALSGGGKAPGMNTPGTGAGSAQPVAKVPKLGGVHGVGEGWYRPIVYVDQVMLVHDFVISTKDHHAAGNQVWLKHLPSGQTTKGFPSVDEAERWIKARCRIPYSYTPSCAKPLWNPGVYPK